jgi:hypothetical protein
LLAKKVLYCAFATAVFAKIFLISSALPWLPDVAWNVRYQLFRVSAFTWPGADARNIQVAAYCAKQGFPYFGSNSCQDAAVPLRANYPEANAPVLNYPSLWPRVYGLFDDFSETFFMRFWYLNAWLLVAAFFILSVKYNYRSLALFLFSPVSLLAVERGNIDATTFFVTFVPLVAFAFSRRLQSFFLGVAAAMKIFPACAYLALTKRTFPFVTKDIVLGFVLALPLIISSFLEIPAMVGPTTQSFTGSYGLLSLLKSPVFSDQKLLGQAIVGGFLVAFAGCIILLLRSGRMRSAVRRNLESLQTNDLIVLLASASIFLCTFFLFISWAYRLIFVAPIFFVLSLKSCAFNNLVRATILAIFWLPLAPGGWSLSNLMCFPLAILVGITAVACWDVLSSREELRPSL